MTTNRYLWSVHSRTLGRAFWDGKEWHIGSDEDIANHHRAYYPTYAEAMAALELADTENMDAYITREL